MNKTDHHHEHAGEDNQTGKDKKHEFRNGKPVLCTNGLVNVDKDQGRKGGEEYQPGDILFFVQVFRDISALARQIGNGEHPLFPSWATIDLFAYSIGSFLA